MTCSSLAFTKIRIQNLWFLSYVLMYCAVTPVRLHFKIGTSLGIEASPLRRQTSPLTATARRHWGTPLEEALKGLTQIKLWQCGPVPATDNGTAVEAELPALHNTGF